MLRQLFRAATEVAAPPNVLARASATWPLQAQAAGQLGGVGAGQPATFSDFQGLHAVNIVVNRCVTLNATNLAQGRLVLEREPDGAQAEPLPSDHSAVELFRRVNDQMTFADLLEWTGMGLDYTGNAYWELVRRRPKAGEMVTVLGLRGVVEEVRESAGTVVVRLPAGNVYPFPERMLGSQVYELWPLNPARVTIAVGPQGVTGYVYSVNASRIVFPPDDVLHFRYPDPNSDFYGISPLRAASKAIEADVLLDKADAAVLRNGARLSGVLTMEKEVSQVQIDAAVAMWKATYSGAENAGKTAFIRGGKDYHSIAMSPAELESFQRRTWNKSTLQQALGVYPVIYGLENGDTSATRENSTTQRKLYFENTIVPRASRIDSTITERLFPRLGMPGLEGVVARLDYSETPLMRELLAAEAVSYAPLVPSGVVLQNDVRELLSGRRPKFEPLPYGRKWWGPFSTQPLADADSPDGAPTPAMAPGQPGAIPGPAEGGAPADAATAAPATDAGGSPLKTADSAMNGAQVQAALSIVMAVAAGSLPRDSGVGQLMVFFNLTHDEAEAVMGSVGKTFKIEAPAVVDITPGGPPAPEEKPAKAPAPEAQAAEAVARLRTILWDRTPHGVAARAVVAAQGLVEVALARERVATEALAAAVGVASALAARDWNDDDHPRDEAGKFTSGGGGDSADSHGSPVDNATVAAREADMRGGPGAAPVQDHPGVAAAEKKYGVRNKAGIDTSERYKGPDGKYSPERAKLHADIIDAASSKGTKVDDPEFVMLGGGPAAGKSTLIDSGAAGMPDNRVTADGDEFKKQLPEYAALNKDRDMRAASYAHEESSELSKAVVSKGLREGKNVVMDGTGDNSIESVEKKAAEARAAGHRVRAEYVTVSVEEAVRRNNERAAKTGRKPPELMLRAVHKSVSNVVRQAIERGTFDKLRVWDTEGHGGKGAPKLIASAEGKSLTIHDHAAWQKFLDKGRAPDWAGKSAGTLERQAASAVRAAGLGMQERIAIMNSVVLGAEPPPGETPAAAAWRALCEKAYEAQVAEGIGFDVPSVPEDVR